MSKAGDPRLGDLFLLADVKGKVRKDCINVAMIGYPCDDGVERNNGRVGAKNGPQVIWSRLPKLGPLINPELQINICNLNLVDRGNVPVFESLEETHVMLTKAIKSTIDDGFIAVVVGGGNDQSYCNAKGLMNSLQSGNIGVVNIDAHLDVRPLLDGNLAHSGSPFRQLLQDEVFKRDDGRFCEFSVQGNQSSAEHAQFVKDNGGDIIWLSQVRYNAVKEFEKVLNSFGQRDVFISFDIDSIQSSDCPGVSCPATIGLSSQDALDICFAAGRHENTRMLDLSEFNPEIEKHRTGTLVCNMIYYFLMGLSKR